MVANTRPTEPAKPIDLLTAGEAAGVLHVSEKTVSRLIKSGKLKRVGYTHKILIDRKDLLAFVEASKVSG